MLTAAAFRKLALSLPDVVQGEHHGHPDFRLHGRVFASLHPDELRAMVRVAPGVDQQRLIARDPEVWAPATGAWGRAGCTMLVLARAERAAAQAALAEAWQFCLTSGPTKPSRTAARASKKSPASTSSLGKAPTRARARRPGRSGGGGDV